MAIKVSKNVSIEQQKKVLVEEAWLKYYNQVLFEKGVITEQERNRHGRKFCVSDFRQTQEYHSYNVHNRANTPCPPLSPSGWNGMRAGTA